MLLFSYYKKLINKFAYGWKDVYNTVTDAPWVMFSILL
jgi:hypothetical protein